MFWVLCKSHGSTLTAYSASSSCFMIMHDADKSVMTEATKCNWTAKGNRFYHIPQKKIILYQFKYQIYSYWKFAFLSL